MANAKTVITDGTHNFTEQKHYTPPQNPAVQEHLKWFRGLKLGLMMHWSPASQFGLNPSWPLSDGDRLWSQRDIDWTDCDMDEFREQYWGLNRTFNPVRYRPEKWARMAKECGFRYLVFTTKHHDGFCMFNTKTTDYRVTHPDCPFSINKNADIVGSLFDAFRAEGLGISAYFSKPDWHSDAYWHRAFGTAPNRNVNYEVQEHPALWEEFVRYTHEQLLELTTNYGKIDTLWLDGGWVRADNAGQDIRLGEVVDKIRATTQPHMMVCDRTVGGKYEDIVTPEQRVPGDTLDIPWESNVTIGTCFSYRYDDVYKSTRELVCLFTDVLSKGGNLALNITPRPDGELPRPIVQRLHQLGEWIAQNQEAIYDSAVSPCRSSRNIRFTHKGSSEYLFYQYDEMPYIAPFIIHAVPVSVKRVRLLRTGQEIAFTQTGETLTLDTSGVSMSGAAHADCYALDCE